MRNNIVYAVLILNCLSIFASPKELISINKSAFHAIEFNKPSTSFFEGAVLGNGGMGVIVTARPDAVSLHFGHNNVWDIRIAEDNRDKIGTFADVFKKAQALSPGLKSIWDDKSFNDYLNLTADNYRKPYPRPFPCGTVVLGFDRRKVEVLGHKIFIDKGICEVYLLNDGRKNTLQLCRTIERRTLVSFGGRERGRSTILFQPFTYFTRSANTNRYSSLFRDR